MAPRLPTYSVEEPDGEQLYMQFEYPYVRVVPVKVVKEKNRVHEPETVYSFQIGEKYALSEVRTAKTTIKFR